MSQPHLLTIDFLGIGIDHQNEIPQLDSTMDCPHQSLHSRSTQSCLGKIRPHMLQQVLSHGCFSDSDNFHRGDRIRVCEGIKILDLFPQHPLGFQANGEQEKGQSALLDSQTEICEAVTTNPRQTASKSEESTEGEKQSHDVERSNFNLPMAKRLSLQRFLQKRKDRFSRVTPYMTSSK